MSSKSNRQHAEYSAQSHLTSCQSRNTVVFTLNKDKSRIILLVSERRMTAILNKADYTEKKKQRLNYTITSRLLGIDLTLKENHPNPEEVAEHVKDC